MKYHEKKRDALLMAPQTERGYLRKATGTPVLVLNDAYPDPIRSITFCGKHSMGNSLSYPVWEHLLTEQDTRALTAVTVYTFSCAGVAAMAAGKSWLAIATHSGYQLLYTGSSGNALSAYPDGHVVFSDTGGTAKLYADASATEPAVTFGSTLLTAHYPLPADAVDITEQCTTQTSYPAAPSIPAGTPLYWSVEKVVTQFTADTPLRTGDTVRCEGYGGTKKILFRQKMPTQNRCIRLPADAAVYLQSAAMTVKSLSHPHLKYTYDGLQDACESRYYLVLDQGYLIIRDSYAGDCACHYTYDTVLRQLTVSSDITGTVTTLEEGENTFYRTDTLPDGMTESVNRLSAVQTVVSYEEVSRDCFPTYTFAGLTAVADDLYCFTTGIGIIGVRGSLLQAGMTYTFDTCTMQFTRTPAAGGESTVILPVFYEFYQSMPAGAKSLSCQVTNPTAGSMGIGCQSVCYAQTAGGDLYSFVSGYSLRAGEVFTLDEAAKTVTDSRGFTYALTDASDALSSDLAYAPTLWFENRQRRCVILTGNTRTATFTTPSPNHPLAIREAGRCTLQDGSARTMPSFPATVEGMAPSTAFLLAGDTVGRDRFCMTKEGKIILESRFGRYAFTGTEEPSSVSATETGYAIAYTLFDSVAADGSALLCTHFHCQSLAVAAEQSVFCLTSGTGKAVFLLRSGEFPAADAAEAKQRFLAFLADCAAAGNPVTVLFRRPAPLTFDLTQTSRAAVWLSFAPVRGNSTLSYSVPAGCLVPDSAEMEYYSHTKGD